MLLETPAMNLDIHYNSLAMFDSIFQFEDALAEFTCAPYVVATDCCTHAIELALRIKSIKTTVFTPFTYLSIPMLMHKLDIKYKYAHEDKQQWTGEYKFGGTNIWDSARTLRRDMYRPGEIQCLSFGHDKPLTIGRGGAILLDDPDEYFLLKQMCYDGRDLKISPWQDQKIFHVGYHYRMTIEEAERGIELLDNMSSTTTDKLYPDLRNVSIIT